MEEFDNRNEVIFKYLEAVLIIGIGMYFHLNKISVIELQYSRLPGLQPNKASTIFTFSVLCILAVLRPFWPSVLRKPPRLLRLILELALALYLTDIILRQVWVPLLRGLVSACIFLSDCMGTVNRDLFYNKLPALATWTRGEFFYVMRMLLALMVFLFMAQVTGLLEGVKAFFRRFNTEDIQATTGGRGVRRMESPARQMTRRIWDIDENPVTPIRPKRRRSRSISRRRARIYLDYEPEDDTSC